MPLVSTKFFLIVNRLVRLTICAPLTVLLLSSMCHAGDLSTPAQGNAPLKVSVTTANGSYAIGADGLAKPVLDAQFAVEVDNHWVNSREYPKHDVKQADVTGELGAAKQWTMQCSGLPDQPDLTLVLRAYNSSPFGDVQVIVGNSTSRTFHIQAIRPVWANGGDIVDLGGKASLDRVLSDSFSEDRPAMQIFDLQDAENGMHRGVNSQLIYNRESHESLFLGALTTDRFLSVLRLRIAGKTGDDLRVASYEVDSTGTTELEKENSLQQSPPEDQIELTLPLKPGDKLASERLLFSVGKNYHHQLEVYGVLIKQLHHARVSAPSAMGWWSWTAYYFGLSEGTAITNAKWLAQNLKSRGYNFFHIDEGYQYARGEYTTPDAALFPHGMRSLEHKVLDNGLTPGIWTAPFEVTNRAWVYENHKDWLVHNAKGQPIPAGYVTHGTDSLYILDTTNPGAQQYLRKTYETLVGQWGIRYIKLDFMDDSAIEGYYYRPNTTAMEAQRIGLGVIRQAVGDKVLLDKDGSVMLNPVGYVDTGRISQDTGHTFGASKDAATGIAARYYMNRNFFVSDPDAFTVSKQLVTDHPWHGGIRDLTLNEAQVSIALAAVTGGMFEIGDDLPTLGADPDRMALVENEELIRMVRLGRASIPLDLMSYAAEDKQPSVFMLREDNRTKILTVFNWTDNARTQRLDWPTLGLSLSDKYQVTDVLKSKSTASVLAQPLVAELPPRSVRVLKIVDTSIPIIAPSIIAHVPHTGRTGETVSFSADADTKGEPVISYAWNFGDGVTTNGNTVTHTFTHPGEYQLQLRGTAVNGVSAVQSFQVSIEGHISTQFIPAQKRRYSPSN